MVGERHSLGFPILGHNITYIHFQCVALTDSLGHPIHQQVGDHAGVKAPRSQHNKVGLSDSFQGRGGSHGIFRQEPHLSDPAVLGLFEVGNKGFPHHCSPVFKSGFQFHIGTGHREHPA